MILAVIGSRTTEGKHVQVYTELDKVHTALNVTEIVTTRSRGAGVYGYLWALNNGVNTKTASPDWENTEEDADTKRHRQIINRCDRLIAFWDGESKEIRDAISYAKEVGKLTKVIIMPKESVK